MGRVDKYWKSELICPVFKVCPETRSPVKTTKIAYITSIPMHHSAIMWAKGSLKIASKISEAPEAVAIIIIKAANPMPMILPKPALLLMVL